MGAGIRAVGILISLGSGVMLALGLGGTYGAASGLLWLFPLCFGMLLFACGRIAADLLQGDDDERPAQATARPKLAERIPLGVRGDTPWLVILLYGAVAVTLAFIAGYGMGYHAW